jgi:hypothetical protein
MDPPSLDPQASFRDLGLDSVSGVEFIHSTSGMADLQRILERIGQGSSTEAALRSTIHSDYRQLQDEVARYLKERYGN